MIGWVSAFSLALALAHPFSPRPEADLEHLVAEALARAPVLQAARARVAARGELEAPATALPDPMVESVVRNVGFSPTLGDDEDAMLGIEARQVLPYPGKRAAARSVAVAETAEAAAAVAELERSVAAEVATLYGRLYALDREAETLVAARELVDLLEQVALGRYATGEGDQEGVLKIQIQAQRVSERLGDLENERHATVAALNRWLDRPGDAPLAPVETLPAVAAVGPDAELLALSGSTEVARAGATVRLAQRRVEQARLGLKPDFSAGAGFASRGGFDPILEVSFGVEWPLWRRQKQLPHLHAAELELEAARRQQADAEAMVRAEAAHWRSAWTNADRQAERYREGILPQTSAAVDAARASYLVGRGDFSTVIEDFNLWLEARVALARREAERFTARAQFDRLAGPGPIAPSREEFP
ncbi:MAG: TolC family protein [Thermoanaerobaculia bacterium]|nr:TolC family protein [Thermoanaerobaculia bacterium]